MNNYLILIYFLTAFFLAIAFKFLMKIWGYAYSYFFWGGINVPTTKEKVAKMVELLEIKPGEKVVDLGSGDGNLMIALAKAGAIVYGYEINPFLVKTARQNIKDAGFENTAFVYRKNLWKQNIKDFDAIAIFPMKHMMARLEKKFNKELKPGVRIVSNYFTFPTWKPYKVEDNVYLYIKK